jgi:hypothetical protein
LKFALTSSRNVIIPPYIRAPYPLHKELLMNEIFTLKNRLQWRVASSLLRSLGLPVGHGWDKTIAKLPELDEKIKDDLNKACRNHILCGDKSVRAYRLKHRDYSSIIAKANSFIDKSSLLTKSYPYSLGEEELNEVEINAPEIVFIDEDLAVAHLVFASRKAVRVREPIDRELLAEALEQRNLALSKRIMSSHEVISVRIEQRHAYDLVCIHKERAIAEVRVDIFENLNPSLKVLEIEEAHQSILNKFNEMEEYYLTNQLNLYPAINGLLHINEGGEDRRARVTRFGYLGPTGICREERKLHGDVRSDPTHLAALAAHKDDSAPFTPYDIEVQFPGSVLVLQPYIALALHGTETLARSEKPVLGEMTVTRCLYETDFRAVTAEVYDRVG